MAWEGGKSAFSLGLGVVLIALGVWPLLHMAGILIPLPGIVNSAIAAGLPYVLILAGCMLLIDAIGEWGGWYCWASVVVGLLSLAFGLLLALYSFGIVPFLVPAPVVAYSVLFMLQGAFLVLGSFLQL